MSIQESKESLIYDLRPMEMNDIDAGMQLKAFNNWNQTREGWDLLLNYPKAYNWVAELEGEVVGTVSMAIYPPGAGWIGMMLVHPDYQGRGIGRKLMDKVLSHTDKVVNFYLDATAVGKILYDKLGFIDIGIVNRMVADRPVPEPMQTAEKLLPISTGHLKPIIAYDQKATGMNRAFLLEYLVRQSPEHAFVYIVNNEIKGYCLGRPGSLYFQIGPVIANNEQIAKLLLNHVSQLLVDQPVAIDLTKQSESLMPTLMEWGFKFQRSLTRMQLGVTLRQGNDRFVYISAGPEVG